MGALQTVASIYNPFHSLVKQPAMPLAFPPDPQIDADIDIGAGTVPAAADAAEHDAPIARQPIVDLKRAVIGYELFDRNVLRSTEGYSLASDAAMLFNALSYAGTETLVGRKLVFVNCTYETLRGTHLELVHPEKVVLEVPVDPAAAPEAVAAQVEVLAGLRKRGFQLAFDQGVLRRSYAAWLPLASFVKLDTSALQPQLVEPLVKFCRAQTKARLIAEKVETAEQYERMRGHGIELFQGYWFAKPTVVQAKALRPAQANIIQLINLVRREADSAEIEQLLKRDPTLSFNLMRFINSSGFGLACEITSFRHAVMILGMKKLFRWAALLLTTSQVGGAAPAVGTTAVVRGRLMELLAAELLPPEECDNAFVVGVFSYLDVMLGVPLENALSSVALPQSVADALLRRTGIYAPFLRLVEACENGDDTVFGEVADALHLSGRQINMAHLQALDWAESLGDF
jgi:EAL and modified HD-GYP domain-containing signal transduction protein